MSYAFWPALDTVERFNRQVLRCAKHRVGASGVVPCANFSVEKAVNLITLNESLSIFPLDFLKTGF